MRASLLVLLAMCPWPSAVAQSADAVGSCGPVGSLAERIGPGSVVLVRKSGGPAVPHPTIQAAVDASEDGDTVLLSDGRFVGVGNRGVVVTGRNVEIRSRNGAEHTVIDCQGQGRAFDFLGPAVTEETLLRGITILNGNMMMFSGAVYCDESSRPTIEQCRFVGNRGGLGGALYYASDGTNCAFVRDCLFIENSAFAHAGAVFAEGVILERCRIERNEAGQRAGGILAGSDTAIRDSVFKGNRGVAGGGVVLAGLNVTISGCTFVGNDAGAGGAVYSLVGEPQTLVENSVLWGNTALYGPQFYQGAFFQTNSTTLRYCVVEGGLDGLDGGPDYVFFSTFNIIEDDPLLAADASLLADSPCVDTGDPSYVPAVNEGDIENQPRANGVVDIGADERWGGFALGLVGPGRAGAYNSIRVTGAEPGTDVFFFFGVAPGQADFSFAWCPALVLEIESPALLDARQTSGHGVAEYGQHVPAELNGVSLLFQAVAFDPRNPAGGCSTSNLVQFRY